MLDACPPRIGRALALFVPPQPKWREPLLNEFDAYVRRWGANLRWWCDDAHGYREISPELLELPRRQLVSTRRRKPAQANVFLHGAERQDDPHPNFLAFSVDESRDVDETNGILEMWQEPVLSVEAVRKEALAAAERVRPTQGYAGWAVCPYVNMRAGQSSRELQYAVSQRFLGVEIEDLWFTANATRKGLRTVQWLTIVGSELLKGLGRKALDALPKEASVHEYSDGVVIQAGPAPSIGDVNADDHLPLYRAVAKILAPIRNHEPLALNIEEPNSLGREETRAWFRRLERDS